MSLDIREAFERFKRSISSDDAQDFEFTTPQDVRATIREIEQQQGQRALTPNMNLIGSFLMLTEEYSDVIGFFRRDSSRMALFWV